MSTAELTTEATPEVPPPAPSRFERGFYTRAGVIAVGVLLVIILLPQILSLYYIDAMTQVAVYSIVALGLGVLVGRVGLISLGQAAVLAIGAWVAARLLFATSLPYEVVVLLAGLITMALGTLVGLPALRMRGLYLALITLMLAGAITVVLASLNFPNGGHGFSGYNGALLHIPADPPPQHRHHRPSLLPLLGGGRGDHVRARARARAHQARTRLGRDPPV